MHFKLLYPTLYLGAHDLRGQDVPLTIRLVQVEDLKTKEGVEKRPVVYFEEIHAKCADPSKEKRLVLNKTNATTIASMHGNEVDDWIGKRIALFPTEVSAFGKSQEAIRVRPRVPAPAQVEEPAATGGEE